MGSAVSAVIDIVRDIWLCDDCTMVAANGEHHPDDSAERETEIEVGLSRLPHLMSDDYENEQAECSYCGWHGDSDELVDVYTDPEYPDWTEKGCPQCKSPDDISKRDNGRNEFSFSECDCCGSTLGGGRTRFAQLIFGEEPQRDMFKEST